MAVFVLCSSSLVVAGAYIYYHYQIDALNTQEERQNGLLFAIAQNGVCAHIRNGMYHPDHLDDWFTGLSVAAGLGGMRLCAANNVYIVATGVYLEKDTENTLQEIRKEVPAFESLARPAWRRGGPRGFGRLSPQGGVGAGGGWRNLPPGPYTFVLAMDPTPWIQRRAGVRNHTLLGVLLAVLCVVLMTLILVSREHRRRLQRHLSDAEAATARQSLLARLGAGLAHETRNPLGLIRGMAQGIAESLQTAPETRDRALRIIDETDRVAGQIDSFLSLAKPVETQMVPVPLAPLFENIAALVRDECGTAKINFRVGPAELTVLADVELLRKALLNLLLNAFKACKEGDEVILSAENTDARHGRIVVRDTGCGIAPEDLPRVTEPYYSRFKEGTGLGLTLTSEIVQKFGGHLQLESKPDAGTTVHLANLTLAERAS
ncbi:MAG: Sensor protein ZraS [Candidatus Hydrogenedentes bacterium ADurb.Bin101]|nr:hypothetical protein [Candidatus Hydrogenedentota bacterium]OQC07944.1 MAG: Sensor protein ZraS [Candidatus Hydrogenedentes bacterium ADurb.Bin101]